MVDSSKQHFGYESQTQHRLSLALSEESNSSAEDAASDGGGGSVEFHLPWRRRHFIHSDLEYSTANRDSIASSSSGRPASTPGNFPDMHWLPPVRAVGRSAPEVEVEDSKDSKDMNGRVNVWISRLDRLISDSSQTDQSLELYDITPEAFSSQDTLISSGSSTPTEQAEEDEDDDDDDDEEEVKRRGASSFLSLDEVLRGTVCQSTFDSKDCLSSTQQSEEEKPFQQSRPTVVQLKQTQPSPKVRYRKGTVCSDISQACEILNTRYKMEGIAVRKPVMTWSKWNVSQVVRGPHVKSPIWNPTLKRKWDRPNSIVFQELNKEITRRNEELEEIVRKKTEPHQHRPAAPPPFLSPLNPPPPTTSSIPPSSSTPLPTSPPPPPPPRSASDPPVPLGPCVPPPPCPQLDLANPHMEVHRSYFATAQISPQSTSRTDPGVYPSHVTTTIDDAEDEAPPCSPSAAAAATASPRSSSSSSSGIGLLRRMVKSVWNVFIGDRGCSRGEGSSRKSSK